MPKHLGAGARKVWRELLPVLMDIGTLSKSDGIMFAQLCEAQDTYLEMNRALAKTGPLVKGTGGALKRNPLYQVRDQAADQVFKLAREFGLSSLSRSRMSIDSGIVIKGIPLRRADGETVYLDDLESLMCADLPS